MTLSIFLFSKCQRPETVSTTSAEAKDESADKFSPIYIGIGAAIILGLIAALRKQKTVRR